MLALFTVAIGWCDVVDQKWSPMCFHELRIEIQTVTAFGATGRPMKPICDKAFGETGDARHAVVPSESSTD